MPLSSPWPSSVLNHAYEMLSNGRSFNDVTNYLISTNDSILIEAAQIAVTTLIDYHWSHVRSELIEQYRHTRAVTWSEVASLTGFSTPIAAKRHFSRLNESELVHNPSSLRARRAKNLIPSSEGDIAS